jgi:hypothetical protein
MTDLEKLKLNLQEAKVPYFTDLELQNLLDVHGNVWAASYFGCLLKAQSNDAIKLPGGLEIPSNSQYWLTLAETYKVLIPSNTPTTSSTPTYRGMKRIDGQ